MAQQAMNENGQKIFEIFRQGEEKVSVASLARWNPQLKGLVEWEKRCQNMMQKARSIEGHGGTRNHVAEQSNG